MAEVSIVTAARREAAASAAEEEQQGAAAGAGAVDVLNPDAREFLPWWRLGSPARKELSVDAPEFHASPSGTALSVDAPEFPASPSRKALSVDAPEFVVTSPVRKSLSVDAPEFVITAADIGPLTSAAVDAAGGSNATPPPPAAGVFPTGRVLRAAHRPRRYLSRWEEAVKRTIFVKYIDHTVTEQVLAALFQSCGNVADCRICGDPSNGLRYGFVEFQDEEEAYAALYFDGITVGISPLRVFPSRTAICPVNPRFLPQSEDEWEICSRTIYCTNISKTVQSSNLKAYCEAYFGKVCRIKLLDDDKRYTNMAFIEFAEVDGATAALASTGVFADGLRLRMCPSKTPIRVNRYGSWPVLAAGSSLAKRTDQVVNGGSTMVSS